MLPGKTRRPAVGLGLRGLTSIEVDEGTPV